MTDINLRILLSASQGNSMSVVGDLTRALGKGGLQGAMDALAVGAVAAGVAITALSVDKAAAFQNAMKQNVAHAGLAASQFDAVSKSVLNMSTDVGRVPTELAQALYPILSGFSGITNESAKAQTSMEALRLSARDLVGTETKTTVASGALVSAFNALGLQTNNTATNISRLNTLNDQMEATVIAGNMHWDQYANVVGKLATAIKGTNVQWTEASAALATMTNEGFSAQRSQTYLANLFTQLDFKTDSLAKNAKKLNIAFDEQKFKSMSLSDQLNYLKTITGDNSSEVLKLLNNNATALKTYNALESGMKAYKSNLDAIKNSHGAAAKAFDVASSSFDAAKKRMAAAINVLLIDLGTQLLPVLSKVLDWVTPLIKRFADWVTNSRDLHTWLNNVGSFLQYQFLPTLQNTVSWFQQGGPAVDAVKVGLAGVGISLAGIKVAGLVKDLDNAITNAGKMKDTFVNFLSWYNDTFLSGFKTANTEAAASVATSAIEEKGSLATVASEAEAASLGVKGIGIAALGAAIPVAGVALGLYQIAKWLKDTFHTEQYANPNLPDWITHQHASAHQASGGSGLKDAIPSPISISIPRHASGVTNFSGGLAYVHGGEVLSNLAPGTNVTPANRVSMGGHTFIINISTLAGSRSEVMRMVDLLEAEIASRFRGQTPSFGFGGIT